MKKVVLNIFLGCFAFIASATKSQPDTLLINLKKYTKDDSAKVEMLIDYCVANTFNQKDTMLILAQEAYRISQKINYKIGQIRSLSCIGNYYYLHAIYDKSVLYYNQSLALAEKRKDNDNIIIGKSNLASVYIQIKEPEKAVKLFKESDAILVKRGDSLIQNRAALLVNLASAFDAMLLADSAIFYYKKALHICNVKQIDFGILLCLSNIGGTYVNVKKYKEALPYLLESYSIGQKINNTFLICQIEMNIGICYTNLNNNKTGIEYLKKSVLHSKESKNNQALLYSYKNLQSAFYNEKLINDAYLTLLEYSNLKDTITNAEKEKAIADINIKYDTEKKEAAIKELEQQNQITSLQSKQKSIILYSIIGLVIAITLLSYFLFTRYKTKKQNELLKTKLEDAELLLIEKQKASDSEIKAIKSQMNPHFFYNALNSIQGYIYSGDKENAAKSLGLFSDLSRSILESSRNTEISLNDEIELLQNYLKLETMRLPKITYRIHVSETINLYDVYIPAMILQPLVENAIKHGLANKQGQGFLNIKLEEKNNKLLIEIEDDGIGREAAAEIGKRMMKKSASFSTEANMSRIELLNANKTEKITQEIIDKKDDNGNATGTIVKLVIPIELYD
ncbi:MAG: histidine kinase [Bacteroidia bacterium]